MKTSTIYLALGAMGAALLQTAAVHAAVNGAVQTMTGRYSGAVKVQNGRLVAGDRDVQLEDTLYFQTQAPGIDEPRTNALNAVRLMGGEYWRVDVLGLSNQTVIVRSPALGTRQVDLTAIQALEFLPDRIGLDMVQPAAMYRVKGAPLPGSLLWIKDSDVTVQSPIGVIPLPRASLVCYVVRLPSTDAAPGVDELRTTDGSLYRGRLSLDGDQIILQHAVWGAMRIRPDQISYFSRSSPRIQWLSALQGKFEPGAATLGQPSAPEMMMYRQGLVAVPCMQALRLQPAAVMRYAVPAASGARVFQATIAPCPSNAGDVLLQIRADNKDLLQRTLVPTSKPEAVELSVPAGKDLEIIVAYGDRLALPAEVDLCDPIVRETK